MADGSPVLVTGAGGFVGANLVHRLHADGRAVVAVVRPGADNHRLDGVGPPSTIVPVDLRQPEQVAAVVARHRPGSVVHLATSRGAPATMMAVNVDALGALLDASAATGVRRVVVAGSSTEYGPLPGPLTEAGPAEPNSSFGLTKLAATRLALDWAERSSIPTVVLRLFHVHGRWEDERRLLPTALRAARTGRVLTLTTGEAAHDLVHVDDVVDAFLCGLDPAAPTGLFNVCAGRPTTNEEIVAAVEEATGRTVTRLVGEFPRRDWDRASWFGDPTRASATLGWTATIDVVDGVRRTLATEPAGDEPALSVVAPVYGNRDTVPQLRDRIRSAIDGAPAEIVFVDDASPDGAGEVLADLADADRRVRVVTHDENKGQWEAVLTGLRVARGDRVVVLDADLADPPEAVVDLCAAMDRTGADAVFAGRVGRYSSPIRHVTGRLFKRVLGSLSGLPTDAAGYVLLSRRMVTAVVAGDGEPYLLTRIAASGLPVTSVPVARESRPVGRSAYRGAARLRLAGAALRQATVIAATRRQARRDQGTTP